MQLTLACLCLEHKRTSPSIAKSGSMPQSWQYIIRGIQYLQVKASSLDLQMPTRGRVAPKLACVQDIRPHVPELGCTSAVQNEKYIFSFCTAECNMARVCNYGSERDVPVSALPTWGSMPQVGNTLFHVFMYLQVKASSLDLPNADARGRVAPRDSLRSRH